MSSYSTSIDIIKLWTQKGDSENDSFSKFISYWIAFNCWLYTKTNEVYDNRALHALFSNKGLYDNFPSLVSNNEGIFEKVKELGSIENNRIKREPKEIKDIFSFKEVIEALYEIRCNLFHGTKTD